MKTQNELREMITNNAYIFDCELSHVHNIYSTIHDDSTITTYIDVVTIFENDDNECEIIHESFEYDQTNDKLTCVFTTNKHETIHDVNNSIERARIVREREIYDELRCDIMDYNMMRNA